MDLVWVGGWVGERTDLGAVGRQVIEVELALDGSARDAPRDRDGFAFFFRAHLEGLELGDVVRDGLGDVEFVGPGAGALFCMGRRWVGGWVGGWVDKLMSDSSVAEWMRWMGKWRYE